MNIEVNCEYKEDLIASVPVAELAAFVLSQEDCPQNAEVSMSFVDDDEMARLNREFRGKTGPTDVLSFECDGLDDEMGGECDEIPGMPFELGDVIVAVDVAERQTEQFGTTFEGELSVLLVHGLCTCAATITSKTTRPKSWSRARRSFFAVGRASEGSSFQSSSS